MSNKKSEYIKILVSCDGDPSVGIWGDQTEILIEKRFVTEDYGDPKETRKWLKEQLTPIFSELFDDQSTHVIFEDECWNCGKIGDECKCREE